jgi:large subunit ribosomal protein L29
MLEMKFSDIKGLSADLLKEEILKAKKEQLNLRFQRASGQLEKPSRIRELRRDVARLKTAQSAQKNAK